MNRVTAALVALVIAMGIASSPNSYASINAFKAIKGEPAEGKVNIQVVSYHYEDDKLVRLPEEIAIDVGHKTSYIPVINNLGDKCSVRFKIYADCGGEEINIGKYCYGMGSGFTRHNGWLYYEKPFEAMESIQICEGFEFPDEWKWQRINKMNITVEAEAVADEDSNTSKSKKNSGAIIGTGDNMQLAVPIGIMILSLISIMAMRIIIKGRRKRDN